MTRSATKQKRSDGESALLPVVQLDSLGGDGWSVPDARFRQLPAMKIAGRQLDPAHRCTPSRHRCCLSFAAMSRENVQVVQTWCEAINRGELTRAAEVFHPDLEFRYPDEFPGGGTYRGLEEAGRALMAELDAWATFEMEVRELEDRGDHVLATIREHGIGRASGVPVNTVLFSVWTFRAGKVVRLQFFATRQQALEGLGGR